MLGGGSQGKSSHSKQKQSTLLGFFKKIEKVKVPSSSDVISNEAQENVISNTQNHTILSQNSSHDHQPVQIPSKNTVMPEEEEDLFIKPNPKRLKASRIVDSDDESDQASPMPATPSLSRLKSNFQMKSANRGSATPDSSFSAGTHVTPLSSMSALPKATPTLTTTPSLARFKSNLSSNTTPTSLQSRAEKFKEKNEERYSWLLNIKDQNEHPIGHPDYDPRTLHIPKSAWNNFTPFEKRKIFYLMLIYLEFWEIKSKHWDTVVFFKKGKFFELYENDATIGHQHFDLKLTDRV
jgi:DNA mismatch repair protein MSH6